MDLNQESTVNVEDRWVKLRGARTLGPLAHHNVILLRQSEIAALALLYMVSRVEAMSEIMDSRDYAESV